MNKFSKSSKSITRLLFGIIVILLIIAGFTDWIVEWLWLDNLGYEQVFWTIKITQALLLVGSLIIALLYVLPNLNRLGKKFSTMSFGQSPLAQLNLQEISPKKIRTIFLTAGSAISLFFSLAFFMHWDTYFRFNWNETFGKVDPIFGHDIGFYLFRLPFINLVQDSLVSLVFFITIAVVVFYLYSGALSVSPSKKIVAADDVKSQISINLGIWFLLLSWGYYLQRYNLLNNANGVVYGAGFVDVNVKLPIIWILCILCLALGLFAFFQLYKSRFKWLVIGGFTTLIIGGIGMVLLPGAVQKFKVEPNELQLEQTYLKNNIQSTRDAYKLNDFEIRNYDARESLSWQQVQKNKLTTNNIRLWDPDLLIQTYRQLQEIRLYYQFYNVDVDRYETDEGYLQMMLSARELSDRLPEKADTWVNRHLQYTHGYGLVMSPVALQGIQGDPKLVIKDLPPVTQMGLNVDRPAIYYGEHNNDYKIVNTQVKELDYPKGDDNVYTHYDGLGGVSINNFFEKLLFAWEFGDMNILLSDYIDKNSKILFWKTITDRAKRIAPFLHFEEKPYLALTNGNLYWIQDAYTISPDYPYSEPVKEGSYNYIRNSVKVVVDAYDGTIDFYAVDEHDPILNVYRDIFPGMFKTLDEMPEGVREHLRYPEQFFTTQVEKYNTYHMSEPQVFYNNEDLWSRPNEKYGGRQIKMKPYYLLTKLPGEEKLQYLLISPLTPSSKDNMISWMAAKSDSPNYGNVSVFKLPKERLILGPAQIEAKIDQNTEISRQLSLWDQRGSNVIRGNLMVVPIEDSFIYVEPVFLVAEGVDIPQMQRVIATDGDKIAMEPTIDEAIRSVYGKSTPLPQSIIPSVTDTLVQRTATATPEFEQLKKLWKEAEKALRNNNWQLFGDKMDKVKEYMNDH